MRAISVKIGGREGAYGAGTVSSRLRPPLAFVREHGPKLGWALVSIGFFAGIWELLWYFGVALQFSEVSPTVCSMFQETAHMRWFVEATRGKSAAAKVLEKKVRQIKSSNELDSKRVSFILPNPHNISI